MGDPRKIRKLYKPPRNPWVSDQLSQELNLLGVYGLRTKRELWKAQTMLSTVKKTARNMLSAAPEVRAVREPELLNSLNTLGLASDATLDDVLGLTVENILDRRLQSLVLKKGFANSIHHARQVITHRHVVIGSQIVTIPSYLVKNNEEDSISLREGSTIKDLLQNKPEPQPQPETEDAPKE